MSFNYNKHKDGHSGDSFWTSYSDLFLGLSTIFLLLYVVTSLRTGTDGLKQQAENQKLTMQVQDLKNQMKTYESIKSDYLQNQANPDEVKDYNELMDKLTLLQEDSHDENEKLKKAVLENEMKEKSLNKYQQMVRNVINANKFAKTKIAHREEIIEEKSQVITGMEGEIQHNQQLISEGEKKIEQANNDLEKRMRQLKQAYQHNKMTKKAYQQKLAQAKAVGEQQVNQLVEKNEKYQSDLEQMNRQVKNIAGNLKNTQGQLKQTQGQLEQKTGEAQNLQSQLAKTAAETEAQMNSLKGAFEADKARDRAKFEGDLKKAQVGAAERAKREAAFRAAAAEKENALNGKLSGLQGQLKSTEGQLAKAKAEIDARRAIAQEIKNGFQKAGVKADIDMDTGEVLLDFGQTYFDIDSAKLKQEMKNVLEKAMPSYSKSLFGNPKIASKISSVEIIGFASPIYKGKFIDPHSDSPQDRDALKYNMDLSYKRANAIFQYLLVEKGSEGFEHQKDLLPLMKVSGRSFLEAFKSPRNIASDTDFCKINDCKKAQRVIIRFGMDGKK